MTQRASSGAVEIPSPPSHSPTAQYYYYLNVLITAVPLNQCHHNRAAYFTDVVLCLFYQNTCCVQILMLGHILSPTLCLPRTNKYNYL